MSVYLAVAGDVFGGVLFCAVLIPRDVLDEICDELNQFLSFFLPTLVMKRGQLQRVETPGNPWSVCNTTETLEQKRSTYWTQIG